jgi:putative ABC transport system permease protein
MIQDYFVLSFKNLKHRGIRSWLTLLGIFIGVTAVVALISLGNGLEMAVSSQFGVSSTELITVQAGGISGYGPPGSNVVNPLTKSDVEAISKLGSVKIAVGRDIGTIKMEYNDKISFVYAVSVPDGDARRFVYEEMDVKTLLGRLLKDGDSGKVVVGYNYYYNKDLFGKQIVPGKRILLNDKSFEVIGVMEKKGSYIFDNAIVMNEKDMVDLLDLGDTVDIIAVQPSDKNNLEKAKEDIERLMRKRRNVKVGEEDFSVSTPEASLATVNSVLNGVKIFIVLIASISIFIGAIGIVNTMTTSVLERKKEIGIMKAIGARNSQIFFQFFIESGLLGLIGGIIGAFFGIVLGSLGVSGLNGFLGTELKPVIDFSLIFSALFGSFMIGAVAGIIPALNAAKQNPVEALQG